MLRRSGVHFFAFKGCVEGIIGGRWLGRRARDSKAFEDSAPGFNLLEEWSVFECFGVISRWRSP